MDWPLILVAALSIALPLAIVYRPFGDYMARVFMSPDDWRVERAFYRLIGVDARSEQNWTAYLRSVLAFSFIGVLFVYLLQRFQSRLPYSLDLPAVESSLSFSTAVSFVTNTNWQSYSPELTLGYTVQMVGLSVQNFVSAAVGIAVAIALVRGLARRDSGTLGNFWIDLTRTVIRILLPISVIGAIVLLMGGVIQNFAGFTDVTTITGSTQTIPGGPVASQEVIKELGTNGGGFMNANSSHPFENPSPLTNLFEIFLLLLIPFSLPRTFGRMIGDHRQGFAVVAGMLVLFLASFLLLTTAETYASGTAPELAGGAMEGKEQRNGIVYSALFATSSTATSTGAVNSMHDSFTALGGMMPMLNMMIGEIAPGGVGSGLYGYLMVTIIAIFISGLLVGRTPEYLGKKVGPREIKLASLYILVTPAILLIGVALSVAIPAARESVENISLWNDGAHGFSELVYAFTSASNNNGSAFAGLTANTGWLNTALGVAMLFGRFIPMVFVLALAGSFAGQGRVPATAGTMPTHRGLFVGLTLSVILIVTALTFFPVLALGPLAEGL